MKKRTKKIATKGKRAKIKYGGGQFGFHTWELDAEDRLHKVISSVIEEGVKIATRDYDCYAWFASEYKDSSGDHVLASRRDKSTVFVRLPLGPHEDDGPTWSFSLRELVDNMINSYTKEFGKGPVEDDESRAFFKDMEEVFLGLSIKLSEVLKR